MFCILDSLDHTSPKKLYLKINQYCLADTRCIKSYFYILQVLLLPFGKRQRTKKVECHFRQFFQSIQKHLQLQTTFLLKTFHRRIRLNGNQTEARVHLGVSVAPLISPSQRVAPGPHPQGPVRLIECDGADIISILSP